VSLAEITDRAAVLSAIAEFDRIGDRASLAKYGFGRSYRFAVVHEGNLYDTGLVSGAGRRQGPEPDIPGD
jgi:hypothetical protein